MDTKEYIEQFRKKDALGSLFEPKVVSLTKDTCVMEYVASPAHYNPNGILHGGALYTVMDSSQGLLVHYFLDESFTSAATGTATIKYLAPILSGTITITTTVKEKQNRKIFVDSVATDASGKKVATLEEIWIMLRGQ